VILVVLSRQFQSEALHAVLLAIAVTPRREVRPASLTVDFERQDQ